VKEQLSVLLRVWRHQIHTIKS